MIKDIKEINFPAYATLETATASIADMGDRTISTQVKISGDIVPDFSYDWEVEFKGERYIHPVRTPQGTKDNTSRSAKIDMTFRHWAIHEMKREMFADMAITQAGTAIPNKYIADINLNLKDFVTNFNLVLNYYFGGRIVMNLNPEWQYSEEAVYVSLSNAYIWDILQKMHEIYGVRWTLKTNADGVCEILLGYPAEEVSHIFEYGFEGGLLSIQRQVQSTEIRNRLLGRGGSKNLPYRYFKDKDPNNPLFEADPDWIPELANIAFTELRGKTFRDYVRGWKAKRYGGTPMAEPTEAYLAGYNAEKFDPIEYVDDKESIEKYGVLVGALENNEEIYPSIQGAPGDVDMIVDAEQVTDDDVDAAVENDSVTTNITHTTTSKKAAANSTVEITSKPKRFFSVPEGKIGNLEFVVSVSGVNTSQYDYQKTAPIKKSHTIKVYDANSDAEIYSLSDTSSVVNIPAGNYYFLVTAEIDSNYDAKSSVTLSVHSIYLYHSTPDKPEGWRPTFDIWVRNIWGTTKDAGETDQQYADRVWIPILGDRLGNEARVVFASGWLSFSSDWEFPIVGYAYDDSKPDSHWRLTLAKSEAEKDAGRPFIPYEGYNASAGDRFFFIGIDMPYQYVLWAEERLDDYKRDTLLDTAEINPTWVVKTDKVRLNQSRNGAKLIESLSAGAQIRLASNQFISGAYENLYLQSITYNWTADTKLYPDVEVVLSDKVAAVKNPVAMIQSNVESLQRQVGSLSNIQQIIRQVCDQLYLRKDGVEDLSKSPTRFLGKVTGEKFRQGQIGGRDWGIYRDENGNAILEADKIVARQGILVSDLVVNEATYVGGLQINSAAAMNITAVEDSDEGYVCHFDQQQGSVTNKFKIDDIALCQKFDPEDNEVKFYKSRVVAVAETSVTLSKTDVSGAGVPAVDDEIIHYGNYTDKTRQFVMIRDVIGGGYERMLMGLDSVVSNGVEYYFAGKSADNKARWFVGDTEHYAKYENGQLTIKGNLLVTGSDKPIADQIADLDYIRDALGDGTQGLILGTAIIVGYNDTDGNFVPMAGLSGIFDKNSANGGPAAWYGGTSANATSMIFMDGTGYFAEGLFKWDKDTGVNLGNGAIRINYDGSVDFGGNIRIGSTGEETLDSLLTIIAKMSKLWTLDDEGNLVTEKQVVIKNNLIIHGDMASGGEGEDTPAEGVSEVVIDGMRYPAKDGVIDLTEAFANVEVDLSEYYTKNEVDAKIPKKLSALENDLNLGSFAYKNALAVSDIPDLSGKYLPLSGGTIEGTLAVSSEYNFAITNNTTGAWSGVRFRIAGANKGYLGVDSAGKPIYVSSDQSAMYTLLHSGNVGSYNAGSANALTEEVLTDLNNATSCRLFTMTSGYDSTDGNKPTTDWVTGITFRIAANDNYRSQLAVGGNARLYFRRENNGTWNAWKEVAFTDSTVAAAQKLVTSAGADALLAETGALTIPNAWQIRSVNGDGNGYATILLVNSANNIVFGYGGNKAYHRASSYDFTVGTASTTAMLINSSGNVTIGASDLASTTNKLYVDGRVKVTNRVILGEDDNYGIWKGSMFSGSLSVNDIAVYGTKIILYGGNVGIGTESPAYKLDVNGTNEVLNLSNSSGGAIGIRFSRGTNTSWSIVAEGGNLKFIENASARTLASFYESSQGANLSLAGGVNVAGTGRFTGKTTHNGGIDIPNGQQLAFLDASGNRHTIAWDSASNGILIDGNLIVLGELATGLPMQEIPSIPEVGA